MLKKKYRVVGPRRILGNLPGKVFEAKIPKAQEQRLIKAGHLVVTKEVKKNEAST